MDILYIIGNGNSKCDNKELMYSLRSIAKYGKGIDDVVVGGYCPEWLSDEIIKVPHTQPHDTISKEFSSTDGLACKFANVLSTILYVVDNTDIGDEFLVSMDDHFYTREVDFDNYPFYSKFKDNREIPKNAHSGYGKAMAETRKYLEEQGLPIYFLTLHRNMHCSRKVIMECREFLDRCVKEALSVEPLCYMLNYWYAKYGFTITPVNDVKVRNAFDWLSTKPEYTEVFSTADFKSTDRLTVLLKELYPDKCKYEK